MKHNLWVIIYESFFNYPVYLPVLWVVEENPSCSYLAFDTFWHDQNYPKHIENHIQDHLSLILLRKYYFWRISRSIKNRWKSVKILKISKISKFCLWTSPKCQISANNFPSHSHELLEHEPVESKHSTAISGVIW